MNSTGTLNATSATFRADVLASELPVLVDFSADWCPPCKMLKPVLEEVAGLLAGQVTIAVVDVDSETDLAGEYGIASIPALKLFVGGAVVAEANGFQGRDALVSWIDAALKAAA